MAGSASELSATAYGKKRSHGSASSVPAFARTGRSHQGTATEPGRRPSCSPKRACLPDLARSEVPGTIADALENLDLPERMIQVSITEDLQWHVGYFSASIMRTS